MIIPVILAGGSGERLWPLSRALFPKQLLSFSGKEKTLLQNTASRIADFEHIDKTIVICNIEERFLVAEQLRRINFSPGLIILEPEARNTAAAISVAIHKSFDIADDPILLVMPSDHYIEDEKTFSRTTKTGKFCAEKGYIATFGVPPTSPETTFGYIKKGKKLEYGLSIESFKEKPDSETAKRYLESGNYFWNSGIFMFKASIMKKELEKFTPELVEHTKKATGNGDSSHDFFILQDEFGLCQRISIDYAVMEKTKKGAVIPLDTKWDDLGTWDNLWRISKKDENGNVVSGDIFLSNVENSYLHSESRLIAAGGVKDTIVVETPDAILITSRNDTKHLANLVEKLKIKERNEVFFHKKVYKPWGYYEVFDSGDRFLTKRITVFPGAVLSLQKHLKRAEHWIVARGIAMVTCGEKEFLLKEDEYAYIPVKTAHRLKNPGTVNLELIEIQTGENPDEKDIIRIKDKYGRKRKHREAIRVNHCN